MSAKVASYVVGRLLDLIEKEKLPLWQKPWQTTKGGPQQGIVSLSKDRSAALAAKAKLQGIKPSQLPAEEKPAITGSGKPYRGINALWTNIAAIAAGYSSNIWLTKNQIWQHGGNVRSDQWKNWVPIVVWKFVKYEKEENGKKEERGFWKLIRFYQVWNVDQTEGLNVSKIKKPSAIVPLDFNPIQACEEILTSFKEQPKIEHVREQAFYNRKTDIINLPPRELFKTIAEYYATLFHEVTHWTGHASRINRASLINAGKFGDENYSEEELVAEIGGAILCGHAGIENDTLRNSASYLAGWLKVLRAKPEMLIKASQVAQKAVDWLLGVSFEEGTSEEDEELQRAA